MTRLDVGARSHGAIMPAAKASKRPILKVIALSPMCSDARCIGFSEPTTSHNVVPKPACGIVHVPENE